MPNFNQVTLMGNLTRDPELKYIPSGQAVCEFSMAINERYTGKDGQKVENVHFIDIVAWAKTAEVVAKYCAKGNAILVSGKLTQERWQDKTSGQNRSKIKVTAEKVQFLFKKEGGESASQEPTVVPEDASF